MWELKLAEAHPVKAVLKEVSLLLPGPVGRDFMAVGVRGGESSYLGAFFIYDFK